MNDSRRLSPARAHFLRATAATAPEALTRPNANAYELMLAKLDEDRRRLHNIQSTEQKIVVKRELLPEYGPWIDGVLAGNHGQQDDVLMTVMLWRVDTGDFAGALQLGRYAIEHNLAMPDRFKRSVGCLLAEEFADTALRAAGAELAAYADTLGECLQLTAEQDMPDEVRAKLHKARAYALLESDERPPQRLTNALENLQRALQLHDRSGVKKDIEKLERELKNTAGNQPA